MQHDASTISNVTSKKRKNEDASKNKKKKRRSELENYKYENGDDVLSTETIIHEGRGRGSRHYVLNSDGSKKQVFTKDAFRKRKSKENSQKNNSIETVSEINQPDQLDNLQDLIFNNILDNPLNIDSIINASEQDKVSSKTKKYKYANGDDVPSDVEIMHEGKGRSSQHYIVNGNGLKEYVLTRDMFCYQKRRGYMYEDGKQALGNKNKVYVYDDGKEVPTDVPIKHEGKGNQSKHYVLNPDGSKEKVFTKDALYQKRKNSTYVYKDGKKVSPDLEILNENGRRYVLNPDRSKEPVYTPDALRMKKSREKNKKDNLQSFYFNSDDKSHIQEVAIMEDILKKDFSHLFPEEESNATDVCSRQFDDESHAQEVALMEDILKKDFSHLFPEDQSNVTDVCSRQADDLNDPVKNNLNQLSSVKTINDNYFYGSVFNLPSSPLLFGGAKQNSLQNKPIHNVATKDATLENNLEDDGNEFSILN